MNMVINKDNFLDSYKERYGNDNERSDAISLSESNPLNKELRGISFLCYNTSTYSNCVLYVIGADVFIKDSKNEKKEDRPSICVDVTIPFPLDPSMPSRISNSVFNIKFNKDIGIELPEDIFDRVNRSVTINTIDYSKYINVNGDALYYKDITERILRKLINMLYIQ